ncbi:hypothetical protein DPMN_130361 [Dreissena polymorpha]|uniref:Uncharacterized protein n=1 Tax=Dreissena polymorpha TaxID=45954 RepID=A0A9D4H503_DREPO|nr:hypothetical protein DPMN_130361 [Dreissena polymorpha]
MSSARALACSVPQGSSLGRWLYLTYAGTIFDIVPPSISVYALPMITQQANVLYQSQNLRLKPFTN